MENSNAIATVHHTVTPMTDEPDCTLAAFIRLWQQPGPFNINAADPLDPCHTENSETKEQAEEKEGTTR